MSDLKEFQVYTVRGVNWECNIPSDLHNAQFDVPEQLMEVATRAIEVWKGQRTDFLIKMDDGQEANKPMIGPMLYVYRYNEDRANQQPFVAITHVCLGNAGFYSDSREMQFVFEQEQKANSPSSAHEQQLENFDKLKDDIKKRRKKNIDEPPTTE